MWIVSDCQRLCTVLSAWAVYDVIKMLSKAAALSQHPQEPAQRTSEGADHTDTQQLRGLDDVLDMLSDIRQDHAPH